MADIVDKKTRSRMMSGIRGANTEPEMAIRKALFDRGFRYRLHGKNLHGKPDLVLRKYNAAVFVDGCFWHMHECDLFKWPKTRKKFWRTKLQRNHERDTEVNRILEESGWRVLRIRECSLKGRNKKPINIVVNEIEEWLRKGSASSEITGGSINMLPL